MTALEVVHDTFLNGYCRHLSGSQCNLHDSLDHEWGLKDVITLVVRDGHVTLNDENSVVESADNDSLIDEISHIS